MADKPPPIQPFAQSALWLTASSAKVLEDKDSAVLMIRLGLAWNSLVAQQRFAVSTQAMDGAGAARDRMAAFVIAAALTEETLVTIRTNYPAVRSLAVKGGASDELITAIGKLAGGSHEASPLLTFMRNRVGFHWDPDIIAAALQDFADYDTLIMAEGRDQTGAELLYRLASDALTNAIWPAEPANAVLSIEEQQKVLVEKWSAGLIILARAMQTISDYIHHAMAAYFDLVEVEGHERQEAQRGSE